ncbi:MAG: hypothetical protein, partial [Olavius algarvensis Gamma 1 endosymbiont]
ARAAADTFTHTVQSRQAFGAIALEVVTHGVGINRLVPVDNSLIFINFMNRLRAKRTDSLTNRF